VLLSKPFVFLIDVEDIALDLEADLPCGNREGVLTEFLFDDSTYFIVGRNSEGCRDRTD
jgi:hypothetical protein